MEDVKGPKDSFSRQHFCILACQSKTVYGSIASTYRRDTWNLGTTVNIFHNSNFISFSAQVIPADRKHAGYISTSSSLSSCEKMQRRHLGSCLKLMWPLCFSLLRINSLEERSGPCPNMNPRGCPETSTQCDKGLEPQRTPKVQSQCEHISCWTSTGACSPAQDASKVPPTQGALCPFQIHREWISTLLGHFAWPAVSPSKAESAGR